MTPEQDNLFGWIDAYRRKEQEVGDLKSILALQDARVAELTSAYLRVTLYNCASHAGLPDPATGCRAIIDTVKEALAIR